MTRTETFFILALSITTALMVGCRSGNFHARNLPAEFRVAASQKGNDLNLSPLASSGTSNSLLAPGDLIEVTVATGREDEKIVPMVVRVANNGTVMIPLVGAVPVSGMEAFDAGQNISSHAIQHGIYRHPVITVDIKTKAVNRITVLGAVENPGVHEIPRGSCDVVAALAAAGGLTKEAGVNLEIMRKKPVATFTAVNDASTEPNDIQLAAYQSLQPGAQSVRPFSAPQPIRINLAEIRHPSQVESRLGDRDVIMVPKRKKEVFYVSGLVNEPGQFEIPMDQDLFLLDAIAMAGGRSSPVANKVFVIRQQKGRLEPIVIQASIIEAKHTGAENIRLAAGDTITIEQTPVTVVVDTLSKFIHFSVGLAGRTNVF